MAKTLTTETIGGLEVTTFPLPFESAQPLIPTIGEIISITIGELRPLIQSGQVKLTDKLDFGVIASFAPALRAVMQYLGENGRLEKLAPKLLATTVVVMNGERYELVKEKERKAVFDDHPDIYFPTLFLAGRVTYARFFPAAFRGGSPSVGETLKE